MDQFTELVCVIHPKIKSNKNVVTLLGVSDIERCNQATK